MCLTVIVEKGRNCMYSERMNFEFMEFLQISCNLCSKDASMIIPTSITKAILIGIHTVILISSQRFLQYDSSINHVKLFMTWIRNTHVVHENAVIIKSIYELLQAKCQNLLL